jgi:hypothetical protein
MGEEDRVVTPTGLGTGEVEVETEKDWARFV